MDACGINFLIATEARRSTDFSENVLYGFKKANFVSRLKIFTVILRLIMDKYTGNITNIHSCDFCLLKGQILFFLSVIIFMIIFGKFSTSFHKQLKYWKPQKTIFSQSFLHSNDLAQTNKFYANQHISKLVNKFIKRR